MSHALSYLPKLCRGCGLSSRDVRFTRANICTGCDGEQKAARNARIAERGPRVVSVDAGDCPKHLAWVRALPCAVRRAQCSNVNHAHHVRQNNGGGTGMKPGPESVVPLCHIHHAELHQKGARTFDLEYCVDLRALAVRLAAASPHIKKAENGNR
jgi:hypothetical protein